MTAVRKATLADLPVLVELDSFAAAHPERADEIERWVAAGACHVAESQSEVVGYAALTRSFFHRPFVEMLMVSLRHRRHGIGRTLILHCAELAGPELWTSTNLSNAPMRALLGGCGFVESGRIENLDPGDPELVYLRRAAAR
jgi:GNAT superfamily N-acetyltransferase